MKLTSLGSGSSGNAFLLEHNDSAVLLDCGVGVRALHKALAECERLNAVIISHEHIDHVRSLSSVVKKHGCEVVATQGTLGAIGRQEGWRTARAGGRIEFNSLSISFVGVSHDAAEPCGFFIETPDVKVVVLTDLGCIDSNVLDVLGAADVAVLESNYDEGMLRTGHYPAHLKRRIRSAVGHLSNEDCAAALAHAARSNMTGVWLSHLSHNNNDPDVAVTTTAEALVAAGNHIPVTALSRFDPTQILPFVPPPRQTNLFGD